jgi:hypothetical protein
VRPALVRLARQLKAIDAALDIKSRRSSKLGAPMPASASLERTKPVAREPVRYTQARRYMIDIGGG